VSADPVVDLIQETLEASGSSWSSNSEFDEDDNPVTVYQIDPEEAAVKVATALRAAGYLPS
jgi:hypothetical protein